MHKSSYIRTPLPKVPIGFFLSLLKVNGEPSGAVSIGGGGGGGGGAGALENP